MNEWSISPNNEYLTYSVEVGHQVEALGHIDRDYEDGGWSAWIEEASELSDRDGRTWQHIATRAFHQDDLEIAKAWVEARIALEVAQYRMAEVDLWESSMVSLRQPRRSA